MSSEVICYLHQFDLHSHCIERLLHRYPGPVL
jgi:hypothetical protein